MALIVALMRDKPMPGMKPAIDVPLDRRVEYALNCIDADTDADEARKFLAKVQDRIDNPKLSEQVAQALSSR